MKPVIEVFKTNVQETAVSAMLIQRLLEHFPGGKVSFDLEDCDRVLRVDQHSVCTNTVIGLLAEHGYDCEVMD